MFRELVRHAFLVLGALVSSWESPDFMKCFIAFLLLKSLHLEVDTLAKALFWGRYPALPLLNCLTQSTLLKIPF